VYGYLLEKCPSLMKTYTEETFRDLDGEVFLGLSPASIDMVFPQLSQRDKGLLLARSEYLRQSSFPERDVTPPPAFAIRQMGLPAPTATEPEDTRPLGRLDEGRMVSRYQSDYRSVSPSRRTVPKPSAAEGGSPSIAPLLGDLPRVLIELWRSTDDPDKDEFLAESWLPDLKEVELKGQTMRLALRRSVRKKDSQKISMTRSWFGALVVTARYYRIGNRLEMHVDEAKGLNVATHTFSTFFLRIYMYLEGPSLMLVHETSRRNLTNASCVNFDEEIIVRFGRAGEVKNDQLNQANSSPVKKVQGGGLDSVETLRSLMLNDAPTNNISLLSMSEILRLVSRGDIEQLSPKVHRFEAYLLPTHEISALTGSTYTFKSMAQIDSLSKDSDYMRNHTQLIDLMLVLWGLGEDQTIPQGYWKGDAWLFRHALLSSIILGNKAGVRSLQKASKQLIQDRLIDITEDGFGEAVFTLEGDVEMAKKFWVSPQRRSPIRSAYIPDQRCTLKELLAWTPN
jgi:hypothetical protein